MDNAAVLTFLSMPSFEQDYVMIHFRRTGKFGILPTFAIYVRQENEWYFSYIQEQRRLRGSSIIRESGQAAKLVDVVFL